MFSAIKPELSCPFLRHLTCVSGFYVFMFKNIKCHFVCSSPFYWSAENVLNLDTADRRVSAAFNSVPQVSLSL